jgi:hypothetical protein
MNNLIEGLACASYEEYEGCNYSAERIIKLIAAKRDLSLLWGYINGVMEKLTDSDLAVLCAYALMRKGISALTDEQRKNIRRVVTKFTRKAKPNLARFSDGVKLVDNYYCLMFGKN